MSVCQARSRDAISRTPNPTALGRVRRQRAPVDGAIHPPDATEPLDAQEHPPRGTMGRTADQGVVVADDGPSCWMQVPAGSRPAGASSHVTCRESM